MAGVALHVCGETDEMGREVRPDVCVCGACRRGWCYRCDPTPGYLCPWCCASGSTAPVPPRQVRALMGWPRVGPQ